MYNKIIVIIVAVLFSLSVIDQTLAIKCYRCTVGPTHTHQKNGTQLCLKFSESEEYLIDCPYSTMCMKKVYKLQLGDGQVIETVSRNCANQKYEEPVFKQGEWKNEIRIEEPYQEGCITTNDVTRGKSMTCHCHGSLCNSATKDTSSYHTDAMAVIFVFNAMKYLRSVD